MATKADAVQNPVTTTELPTAAATEVPAAGAAGGTAAPLPTATASPITTPVSRRQWNLTGDPASLSYGAALCYYIIFLTASFLVGELLGVAGTMLCVFMPGVIIAYYLWSWNKAYLTRCSMFEVSIEAFLILMVPLMVAITIIDKYAGMRQYCPGAKNLLDFDDEGGPLRHYHRIKRPPFWRYFFQAFVRAALLEESTKYLAVRRIAWKLYVLNARALLSYASLAGCVFGVVENVNYGLQGGISTIFVRGFLTVPFHTLTGVMQGCVLCRIRFGAQNKGHCLNYLQTIAMPVLFHGTYDLLLFIQAGECDEWMWVLNFIATCLLFTGAFMVDPYVVDLHKKWPGEPGQDIHKLIEDGTVAKPCHFVPCSTCCY